MRNSFILLSALSLAACSDPLANFDRIDDIEAAGETSVAQALPDDDDVAPTDGLLSRLLNGDADAEDSTAPAGALPLPTDTIGQDESTALDDTVVTSIETQEALSTPAIEDSVEVGLTKPISPDEPKGIGGWLRRAATAQEVQVAQSPTVLVAETALIEEIGATEDAATVLVVADEEKVAGGQETVTPELVEPEKRRGLLGILQPVEDAPETVRTASLNPEFIEPAEQNDLAEPKKRRGLFGRAQKPKIRSGPDAREVTFGTVLPYGEVARVCGINNSNEFGQRVANAPEKKGRGYALYDSAPDSAAQRTFYVTGFSDNCARQFTAALAVFGSPETHEQLRYGLPSKSYPYSTTDEAYEKVKSSVCKVGKGQPCGAKITTLERNTAFISTYEKFTDNARWADILLHGGVVVAATIKTP